MIYKYSKKEHEEIQNLLAKNFRDLGYSFRNDYSTGKEILQIKKSKVSPDNFKHNALKNVAIDDDDKWRNIRRSDNKIFAMIANLSNTNENRNKFIDGAIAELIYEYNITNKDNRDKIKTFINEYLLNFPSNVHSKYVVKCLVTNFINENGIIIEGNFDYFIGKIMSELHYTNSITTVTNLLEYEQNILKQDNQIKTHTNKVICFRYES